MYIVCSNCREMVHNKTGAHAVTGSTNCTPKAA